MEEKINFSSEGLQLEGLYQGKKGDKGVVVTHPHPLYGGEMTNPVVESVAGVFARKGYLSFISPPLALLPFAPKLHLPLLQLVITGEEDEIAPAEMIRQVLPEWNGQASFEVLDFADHFYFGFFKELEQAISIFLAPV